MRVKIDIVIGALITAAVIYNALISPDPDKKERDELMYLVQQQGYCAAVRDYKAELPAECLSVMTEVRSARMSDLRKRLNIQPVYSGMPDKAADMLPKPVGV